MTKKTATTPQADLRAEEVAQPPHPLPGSGGCYTLVDGAPVRDSDPETPKAEG